MTKWASEGIKAVSAVIITKAYNNNILYEYDTLAIQSWHANIHNENINVYLITIDYSIYIANTRLSNNYLQFKSKSDTNNYLYIQNQRIIKLLARKCLF